MNRYVKFVAMFFGTCVAGAIVAALGAVILGLLMKNSLAGYGGAAGVVTGLLAGYPIGVIVGIVLFKTAFKYRGALWFGIFGALIGALLPIFIALMSNMNVNALLFFILVLAISPLAGTTAFYIGGRKNQT